MIAVNNRLSLIHNGDSEGANEMSGVSVGVNAVHF